jgi:tRNA pseudouridine13 synthase
MYKLKEKPEDFIVDEVIEFTTSESGKYAIIKVTKRETTCFKVVDLIVKTLGKSKNDVSYAGIKDRNAVTTQYMSIKNASKKQIERLKFDKVKVEYVGQSDEAIRLGRLKGNKFTITVRELEQPLKECKVFPNYFDSQRFSVNNIEIGKGIINGKFKASVEAILSYEGERDSYIEKTIKAYLEKHKNDYVGALQLMQRGLLTLYVGAYQSYLFNEMLAEMLREKHSDNVEVEESFGKLVFPKDEIDVTYEKLPIIGFTTDETEEINKILAKEKITTRSFIVRSLRDATAPGGDRSVWCELKDVELGEFKDGVQTVSFYLKKGSYATMAIKAMMYS